MDVKRDEFPHIPNEPYFSPQEVADLLKVSDDLVRKVFRNEPDVIVITFPRPGRRTYTTLRIPRQVLMRFLRTRGEAKEAMNGTKITGRHIHLGATLDRIK